MSFEFFIGLRYLRAKRKSNFISLITLLAIGGVTLGVMALIIVISVINGFEEKMKEKILGVNSHIVLLKQGPESKIGEYRELIDILKRINEVKDATPFVYFQAMLSSQKKASGVFLRGIPRLYKNKIKSFAKIEENPPTSPFSKGGLNEFPPLTKVGEGRFDGIIIGKELAAKLGVNLNDYVTMLAPRFGGKFKGAQTGVQKFKVAAIFDSGMYEYDLNLAYISLENAQELLGINDAVSGIEITTYDPYNSGKIAQEIRTKLKFPYLVRDWREMNKNLFSALWIQKIILFIIIMLIIIVAAFNIISTLIMVVIEKTKEIAILRSVGATKKSIKKLFLIQGGMIGIVGTLLGNLGGYLSCLVLEKYQFIKIDYTIYYIKSLPVIMDPSTFFIISAYSLLICFLFTFFPAWQASRLNIVEGLRYE